MSYSFPEKCDVTGSTPRTLKISLFLLMQVRERGDHKGLGEHGPLTTVTGSFVWCSWKSSAATHLVKEIRRCNSRSVMCSQMNHKARINGHTWHSFSDVLVKVNDAHCRVISDREISFPFVLLSFPRFIQSRGSALSHVKACTDEDEHVSRSFV